MAPNAVNVTLSRRNLLSLLAKLDGHPPNSACTLIREYGGVELVVKAEEDDVHYAERNPGSMHAETEALINPPLRWQFGCKHNLPNFVHCPECDN